MTGARSKTLGPLALAAALMAADAAQAQTKPAADKPPIVLRAETCLRQKVDRVVADEPNLDAAADFLVNYACAEEVAGETRYLRAEAYVRLFTGIAKVIGSTAAKPPAQSADKSSTPPQNPTASAGAQAAAAASAASAVAAMMKVDPETGDIRVMMPGPQAAQANEILSQSTTILGDFAPDKIPVSVRKLAGDLVLEARERHRAK